MPRVPILTSPSSRDHAQSKGNYFYETRISIQILLSLGVRPGSIHDFCIESHRVTPTPLVVIPKTPSFKKRS